MDDLEYCKLYKKIKYGTPVFRTRTIKGATGATGPTGPTGATGATGPSSENVFVRDTQTLEPEYDADVYASKEGEDIFLSFMSHVEQLDVAKLLKSEMWKVSMPMLVLRLKIDMNKTNII